MHITKKAIITIVVCLLVVFIGYEYYRNLHQNEIQQVITPSTDLVMLRVGETGQAGGMTVYVNGVTDNRCPTDAQCIQAGDLKANVTLSISGSSTSSSLVIGKAEVFGGYTVLLQKIREEKEGGSDARFQLTFLVKKAN